MTRSLTGGFLKLRIQTNCNKIKSDGSIWLLNVKIASGCCVFSALSLSVSCHSAIIARDVVDAASVCPVGACLVPLGFPPK